MASIKLKLVHTLNRERQVFQGYQIITPTPQHEMNTPLTKAQ